MKSKYYIYKVENICTDDDGAIIINPFGSRLKSDEYTALAMTGLNSNNVYRLYIPKFSERLIMQFADFTEDFHKMMRFEKEEMTTFESLRETLFQNLISGEVGV